VGVAEFRALWLADVQSQLGDQLARVALSVLVFARTGSAVITALTYALTFLPALLGTPLGVLADSLPRRGFLVAGDLCRAALLGVMALPGLPLPVVVAALCVVVLIGAPWKAAETALVADILAGEGYVLGTGLRLASGQGAQLAGFGLGGAVVAGVGARGGLALDALTFLVSAAILAARVRSRPASRGTAPESERGWRVGLRVVARDRRLRVLAGYAWLAGAFVAPEGIAAPYAERLGGGARAVGLLLAAAPAGALVGALLYVRLLAPDTRARLVPYLAVAAGLPLVLCGFDPGLGWTFLLWALSGLAMTYQVQVMTQFVLASPAAYRGQAIAVASSVLLALQGAGLFLAGVVTKLASPPVAVAAAGAVGAGCAVLLALGGRVAQDVSEPTAART
jgi:hypothetical protein